MSKHITCNVLFHSSIFEYYNSIIKSIMSYLHRVSVKCYTIRNVLIKILHAHDTFTIPSFPNGLSLRRPAPRVKTPPSKEQYRIDRSLSHTVG